MILCDVHLISMQWRLLYLRDQSERAYLCSLWSRGELSNLAVPTKYLETPTLPGAADLCTGQGATSVARKRSRNE